jgi:hypothetical protein
MGGFETLGQIRKYNYALIRTDVKLFLSSAARYCRQKAIPMPTAAARPNFCSALFSLHMRRYCLYIPVSASSSRLLQQVGQLQQVLVAKQAPPCR